MAVSREFTAKMKKAKRNSKPARKEASKRGRGRPQKIDPSEVVNRADDYRGTLAGMWAKLWPPLSVAKTKQEVINAINGAEPYQREQFLPSALAILEILKDPRFPKRQQTRINYLADSLAARGVVTPRRSRDICARERLKQKRTHRILRVEVYVECSCGYQGPSRDHACLNCGAPILQPSLGEISQTLNILQFEKFPNEVSDY
jgi:hypothetical protein